MNKDQKIRRREFLEQGLSTAYRETDKLVVSVASAVLALSIAFLGRVHKPHESWTLRFGWVLLILSIAAVLVSLLFERADKRRRIKQYYDKKPETSGHADTFAAVLNAVGVLAFLLGLASLAAFLCFNFN